MFPFRLIDQIRDIASKENKTAASVVREAAERYVEETESKKR
jgi:predicted DNA-binding protein|tara:strand:- start:189 stop:314 length:126 start_codon:yes stop_codon:yes gene_type:complete